MRFQKGKILFILLCAAGIFLVGSGIFFFEQKPPLVESVPTNAEAWLWQGKDTLSLSALDLLKVAGVEDVVVQELAQQQEEIMVYRYNNRWYKRDARSHGRSLGSNVHKDAWYYLTQFKNAALIGYFSKAFVDTATHDDSARGGYYLVLIPQKEDKSMAFHIIPRGSVKDYFFTDTEVPYFPTGVVFALNISDHKAAVSVEQILKENIAQVVAFENPIVKRTELPDRTSIQEKVALAELFVWNERKPMMYELVINNNAAEKYNVQDQLNDFKSVWILYKTNNTVILGTDYDDVQKAGADADRVNNQFVYMEVPQDNLLQVSDIMGSGNHLLILQNLKIQSIVGKEVQGGFSGKIFY